MKKVKFTTSIDPEVLKQIKIQAIKEGRSVASILESLIVQYIESKAAE